MIKVLTLFPLESLEILLKPTLPLSGSRENGNLLPVFPYAYEMYNLYWDTLIDQIIPSPGIEELMKELKQRGIYIGEYATTDPDSGSVGFNKISKDSSGNNVRTFINATIYGKVKIELDDDSADEAYNYYVDRSAFKEGDAIVKDDSNQRFIVGETDSLEGVYCINQGYAVFRQVDILDQNEEYAIISSNTSYGLSRYDRIARDSSQVKEQDILY